MFFLEAHDALSFFKDDVVPLSNATIGLDLSDRVLVLVEESDLIDPVLARLDPDLPDWPVRREADALLASVNSTCSGEWRAHAVGKVELH